MHILHQVMCQVSEYDVTPGVNGSLVPVRPQRHQMIIQNKLHNPLCAFPESKAPLRLLELTP